VLAALVAVVIGLLAPAAVAQLPTDDDPRFGLSAGLTNAGTANLGVDLLANVPKPAGFFDPANPGNFGFVTSDMALQGNHVFVGNFNGFLIYDISNPASPTLVTQVVCPGGQGDVSVFGNLLFMSVEETRGRVDCGTNPTVGVRFQGVRVFDISNIAAPVQVAAVQTCRGSHTHTFVEAPNDAANVYVYVSGTAGVRPATTMAGCDAGPATNPNPSRWRIEVIRVPLAAPQNAAIVSEPRLFRNETTGAIDGLQNTLPTPLHPSGMGWGPTPITDACHDITVFEEIGLAAGACEGNGLLIDISDPVNPTRIDAVADPLWAYWHGATFSNDGTKVIFTDEWGGGTSARCRATDQLPWGGDGVYEIVDRELVFRGYYKLPVIQANQENCVTHVSSLVPVPGRDILAQAFYQGGISLVDFTDPANAFEIGYFDRGPISSTSLVLGGLWSTYWYNGAIYGSEIARGLDSYGLTPTTQVSENEILAAKEIVSARLNAQTQTRFTHAPSFAVVRSFRDQLIRADDIDANTLNRLNTFLDRAERFRGGPQETAAWATLKAFANQLNDPKNDALREAILALADA
jgi:hypothetical protein